MSVFPNEAAEFVYIRTYSRWLEEEKRREYWEETVDRYIGFIEKHTGDRVPQKVFRKAKENILNFTVMPSMRAMWAAGEAAENTNVAIYNCAFEAIQSVESFAEALYILMCGAGHGFTVERLKYVDKLPVVPKLNGQGAGTYQIPDSKEGWADSVKHLVQSLYSGCDMTMDYSLIRPRGARLKTFGGRASGPAPLVSLHEFIRHIFEQAQERKLKPIECLDILNKVADIVVVGGVRRSSEISLSDLDDDEMAKAKFGKYPQHRSMSNNSAVYHEKPGAVRFMKEWAILAESGRGERGIINMEGIKKRCPERRDATKLVGVNPCAEIVLRDCQFCNLSEVVIRPEDDLDDVLEKIETATWLGAIQSTFTHFPYLSRKWKRNCEQERLLGVSLTGQRDNPDLFTDDAIKAMKKKAIKVAKRAAKILGINMPAAVTCVKPSGTVSQVVNAASGVHGRHAKYYLRRYRIAAIDPLCRLLKDQGVPLTPENKQGQDAWKKAQEGDLGACPIYEKGKRWSEDKVNTWVVAFPVEAPDGSVLKDDLTAIDQLEYYRRIQEYWCEHNASCTVDVNDDEWLEAGNWVYLNWKYVAGISFLPKKNSAYEQEQMPEETITKEEYEKLKKDFPKIDYSQLGKYELEDNTTGAKAYACTGGSCDI
jgi:ribonucleoside-diphosphate reductase alpha chain